MSAASVAHALTGMWASGPVTLAAQSPAPGESAPPGEGAYPDAELVTPGTIGFVVTFLLAVAVVLLARSLLRRQRAMRAREGVVRRHPIPVERETRRAQEHAAPAQTAGSAQTAEPAQSPEDDAAGTAAEHR
ncbi:hypothetical protein [Brevibacterium salitolerans]|jgi:hypothetical protein|uniref:Uncharacterized protein n=1 Tax=Brevibacterium salitolerans TaxID=1403566 RepID=A0ABP5HTI1_9MICO